MLYCLRFLAGKSNGHFFAFGGRAPDGNAPLLLQDRIVAEKPVWRDIGGAEATAPSPSTCRRPDQVAQDQLEVVEAESEERRRKCRQPLAAMT